MASSSSVSQSSATASSSTSRQRRQSQSTLAAMDVQRGRNSFVSQLLKHGKYVAVGAAGIWWLDVPVAAQNVLETGVGWGRRALLAHIFLLSITIILFLYLALFLPWFRGYIPNYPKWQQSRRLRVIVPVLTTSILLGWACLVFALKRSGHSIAGGAIREAIRDALHVHAKKGFSAVGAMTGATLVYFVVFGLLGFIPTPNVPVRVKKSQ